MKIFLHIEISLCSSGGEVYRVAVLRVFNSVFWFSGEKYYGFAVFGFLTVAVFDICDPVCDLVINRSPR